MATLDDSYKLNEPYFSQENASYFKWLESFTIDDQLLNANKKYTRLLRTLWDIPFEGYLGNDADRGEEGLELRYRYSDILAEKVDDYGKIPDFTEIFGGCRVLEMLIALSMHMYDLMQDLGIYNSVSRWFWEIMRNVDFIQYSDDVFDMRSELSIRKVVDDILKSNNLALGSKGGWFNISGWYKIEIWYQMHEYLHGYF